MKLNAISANGTRTRNGLLSVANACKELVLSKPLTTIGKGVVARTGLGANICALGHVEGDITLKANGADFGVKVYSIAASDVFEASSNQTRWPPSLNKNSVSSDTFGHVGQKM